MSWKQGGRDKAVAERRKSGSLHTAGFRGMYRPIKPCTYDFLGSAAGCIPVELAKLNNLTKLHMRNNKLSGTLPVEIKNLPRLREIYLEGNDVSGG